MVTDWKNLFKVRIANSSKAMMKHEVVKLILMIKLLEKYKNKRDWIRIYTEFELDNGLIPDVYVEDMSNRKNKTAIAYEIQKKYTKEWLDDRTQKYKDYEVPFFTSFDWIPIDLSTIPDSIEDIWDKLEEFVF